MRAQTLFVSSGALDESVSGLARATQSVQSFVQKCNQKPRRIEQSGGQGLTNKASFKQRSRRYKLAAGVRDERFKDVLMCTEAHDATAPAVDLDASGIAGAQQSTSIPAVS